jgi:phosphate/sulfate permease
MDDRAIISGYINKDKDWRSFIQKFYAVTGLACGALGTFVYGNVADWNKYLLLNVALFTVGAPILSAAVGGIAYKAINKRLNYYEKPVSPKVVGNTYESMYDTKYLLSFLNKCYFDAVSALRILEVARQMKPLGGLYDGCDRLRSDGSPETKIIRFFKRYAINNYNVKMNNIVLHATTAQEKIVLAVGALEDMPPSPDRTTKARDLIRFIQEFEPHTFMIPTKADADKSIWSELQDLVDRKLKPMTENAAQNVATNQATEATSSSPRRGLRR